MRKILTLSNPETWHHIPGSLHPADLQLLVCNVDVLRKSRWWEVFDGLRNPKEEWSICEAFPDFEIIFDEKSIVKSHPFTYISDYVNDLAPLILCFYKNEKNLSC